MAGQGHYAISECLFFSGCGSSRFAGVRSVERRGDAGQGGFSLYNSGASEAARGHHQVAPSAATSIGRLALSGQA